MSLVDGVWTYRSFANVSEVTGDFNRIAVWEAELLLESWEDSHRLRGHLGERPEVVPEDHPFLTVSGEVFPGDPTRITFRAMGKTGTAFEGWVYDYDGFLAPKWLDGRGQTPAIVGTVTRTVEHDGAPAGTVFSFIAVKHAFNEPQNIGSTSPSLDYEPISLSEDIRQMLASEKHRLHHQIWHAARNEWASLQETQRDALRSLGWQPGPKNEERLALGRGMWTNGSGEDFLYMHRRMIQMVREKYSFRNWRRLPAPEPISSFAPEFPKDRVGNPNGFAVPEAWDIPDDPGTTKWLGRVKSDSMFTSQFQRWEAEFTNSDYLNAVSLAELGARLEWTIHNWMHMRWSSAPKDPELGHILPNGRPVLDWSEKWLSPSYDHLGETFSSHVNPVFWRLHGWVDDRINDWFTAQEAVRPGVVKRADVHGVEWFEADGEWVIVDDPWEGPRGSSGTTDGAHGHAGHGGVDLDPKIMKQALSEIYNPPETTKSARNELSPRLSSFRMDTPLDF